MVSLHTASDHRLGGGNGLGMAWELATNQGLHRDAHYREVRHNQMNNYRLVLRRLDAAVLTLADLSFFQQWDGNGAELAHCGHLELLRHESMSLVDLWQMVVVYEI